jgi:hypothetical protein
MKHFVGGRRAVHLWQGDQIGRIFAQWVIVFFGQFLENYRSITSIFGYFFHG